MSDSSEEMLPIFAVSPQVFTCEVPKDPYKYVEYMGYLKALRQRIFNHNDREKHIGSIIWDAVSESEKVSWFKYVKDNRNEETKKILFMGDFTKQLQKRVLRIKDAPSISSFDPEVCFAAEASELLEEKQEGFLNGIILTEECRAKIEGFDPSEVSSVEEEFKKPQGFPSRRKLRRSLRRMASQSKISILQRFLR